ncbi:MAG: hypothetical protein JWQ39_2889 [Glaciihabitans sp.]|nr:hypothetical protein [Glaciihabitans sp.]
MVDGDLARRLPVRQDLLSPKLRGFGDHGARHAPRHRLEAAIISKFQTTGGLTLGTARFAIIGLMLVSLVAVGGYAASDAKIARSTPTATPSASAPKPEPTGPTLSTGPGNFSGSSSVVDSAGYSFNVSYQLQFGKPYTDAADAPPGKVDAFLPYQASVTLTNTTPGKNFHWPTDGMYTIQAEFAPNSIECADEQICSLPVADAFGAGNMPATLSPGESIDLAIWTAELPLHNNNKLEFRVDQSNWPGLAGTLTTLGLGVFVYNSSPAGGGVSLSKTPTSCLLPNGSATMRPVIIVPSTKINTCSQYSAFTSYRYSTQ